MMYNKEHYAVMANQIIKGKQTMSLQEAKILRLLITQVVKEDKDFKTYQCKIKDLAGFLDITSDNLYRDIQDICRNLMQRVVQIEIDNGNPKKSWVMFHWMQKAEYDGNGTITLMLSNEVKPYILELEKHFTQYQLENIVQLNSFYAVRLYELLKSEFFKKELTLTYTMDFLRAFFGCEKKYPLFADFRKRVIDKAISEINAKTDIFISDMSYIKTGHAVTSLAFTFHQNIAVMQQRKALQA